MPGFYMVKPEGMSFSKFKYPQGKAVTPLSVEKMDEFVSKLEPKAASRDSTSKDLILKIFKDVFNGDPNSRDRYRYFETRDAENDTEQNIPTTTLQNKELLVSVT
ncbi:unnamed protein product [Chrysodeixis includens]|uniref:Uncharacterized protein n=1 Tax=Chrysodeixis includens TaxID=689277 RepID=A0A9N8PYH5_CHRIL|nr:unnamed protein product [Chrysodeixis includens]